MRALPLNFLETSSQSQETFINTKVLESFSNRDFKVRKPYPWQNFHQFLTPDGFAALYRDFPSLDCFEQHNGIARAYNQRPHNRYYLAYESSIYQTATAETGIIRHQDLPPTWQAFIEELERSSAYRRLLKTAFSVADYRIRYAWHLGFNGSEVSPHVDSPDKIGTHILYFNTQEDWQPEWGGDILVLNGKQTAKMNPDFTDFAQATPVQISGNQSFFFKNSQDGWHGVKPLTCPSSAYRRLFNIIIEYSASRKMLKTATQRILTRFPAVHSIVSTLRK